MVFLLLNSWLFQIQLMWFPFGIVLVIYFLAGDCHFSFFGSFLFGWLIRDDSDSYLFTTWKAAFQISNSTREV